MTSFRRIAIAAMLAVVPALAAGTAWANTELVPGSRLVAPYWDISGDRGTLLFIVNASQKANLVKSTSPSDLKGVCNLGTAVPGVNCYAHLEFYDKTCKNINTPLDLSKQDIDQLDLLVDSDLGGVRGLPSKLGWLDVDVRSGLTGSGHSDTSVQANVLMGTVLISDSGSDFAVAYPMASSQGTSSSGGVGGNIVTRNSSGNAVAWTGGYETFPARVFVPMFFAEGTNHGVAFTSTLAIAGPAQAFFGGGEAPGQALKDEPTTILDEGILIDADIDVVDACENSQSDAFDGHYIFGTLDELISQQVTAPYGNNCASYPAGDVDRLVRPAADAFHGGYLDIANTGAFGFETDDGVVSDTPDIERGLVGVLVQNTPSRGDATRLWGECSFGDFGDGSSALTGCRLDYSWVDLVSHTDLQP